MISQFIQYLKTPKDVVNSIQSGERKSYEWFLLLIFILLNIIAVFLTPSELRAFPDNSYFSYLASIFILPISYFIFGFILFQVSKGMCGFPSSFGNIRISYLYSWILFLPASLIALVGSVLGIDPARDPLFLSLSIPFYIGSFIYLIITHSELCQATKWRAFFSLILSFIVVVSIGVLAGVGSVLVMSACSKG